MRSVSDSGRWRRSECEPHARPRHRNLRWRLVAADV